jgi:hypothetical protein
MEGGFLSAITLGIISDSHCGSSMGLHPYDPTELDDGASYHPSNAQRWIYDGWLAFHERLKDAAKGTDLHYLANGDLVDGDHHGTTQIVSKHPNAQIDILRRCFTPVLDLPLKSMVVVRGTEVHVGPSGCAEESFANWLVAQGVRVLPEPGTGNASHWHYRGSYGGAVVDATHHGRVGTRPWTKANGTLSLAAEIVMEHALRRETPPDLAVRSHFHQWVDTGDAFPTRVIQTPSWQLATAYVKRRHAENLADLGGTIVTLLDGKIERVQKVLFQPERPRVVVA